MESWFKIGGAMTRTCNYVRITVGSAAENAALLKATEEILSC